MGVIRKIVLSLLLVATLAHGQLSVDLNGGDITAPLQHQGKIERQYSPGNIDRSYGDASGQHLAPLDENVETIYVSPEGRYNYRPNYLLRTGSQDPTTNSKNLRRSTQIQRREGLSANGFLTHIAYTFFENILSLIIWGILFLVIGNQLQSFVETALKIKNDSDGKRMFKGIEDSAIANIMTSIDEFKTKYLN